MPVFFHVPWKWNIFLHPHLTLNGLGQHFIVPQHYADLSPPGSLLTGCQGEGDKGGPGCIHSNTCHVQGEEPLTGLPYPKAIRNIVLARDMNQQHSTACTHMGTHTRLKHTHNYTHSCIYTNTYRHIPSHTQIHTQTRSPAHPLLK